MLTDLAVRHAQPGLHWDKQTPGFGLYVGRRRKSFLVLIASGRRKVIGYFPSMSVAEARRAAKALLARKALGFQEPTRTAWNDARDAFLAACQKRAERGEIRPRTAREYARYLSCFPFGRQAIGDVGPRDLIRHLQKLDDRPGEKEHAFRVLRTFMRFCVREHLIDRSPTERMAPPPLSRPRERVLSEDELRAVWHACDAVGGSFGALVRFLILTGCRRGEASRLQWSWVDQEKQTITFPAAVTKNGRTHTIPYGPITADQLLRVQEMVGCPYVFPAARKRSEKTTTINGFSKPTAKLKADLVSIHPHFDTNFTLHDLRRTYASGMQRLGVRLEVTETLLNHVSGSRAGIVGIYQRYGFERECREAVLQWEAWLNSLHASSMSKTEPFSTLTTG